MRCQYVALGMGFVGDCDCHTRRREMKKLKPKNHILGRAKEGRQART